MQDNVRENYLCLHESPRPIGHQREATSPEQIPNPV